MKKIVAVLTFVLLPMLQSAAQVGNEWINYNQSYYKIPTDQNGIYRLSYSALQLAGFPVGSVNPSSIQIFHRGIEQAIYVSGEGDGQFDASDFIEFYGQRNDGTLDAELYKPASSQPHAYYNLFCDTTVYFLTYGGPSGKRMTMFSEMNSGLPTETYQRDIKHVNTIEQYSDGIVYPVDIENTYFDQGEGWTGRRLAQGGTRTYTFTGIVNTDQSHEKPTLELLLVGRNEFQHTAEIFVGTGQRSLGTIDFNAYTTAKFVQSIEWTDIAANGSLAVTTKALNTTDGLSVSYMRLTYPQSFNASGETQKVINLNENAGGKSYIEIQNAAAGMRLFDITSLNDVSMIGTTTTSTLNAVVSNTITSRKILATNATLTPAIIPVTFRHIDPAAYNYIIISHPMLRRPAQGYGDPVKAYAEYRASTAGGGYDTLVLNIKDIYDQFGYGELSPVGILHLMKYLTAVKVPRYLFIIGKGLTITYDDNRDQGRFTDYPNLIPASGYPASDIYYSAGLAGTTYEPAVPTGRLTASTPDHVAAYLNKVIEAEALPFDDQRRKTLLHLSGGIEEGEPERFKTYVHDFEKTAEGFYLGGHVSSIAKRSRDVTLISIADEVNKGLGLITFFGHSSAQTLDFDIGYVTDPVMGYNNKGKYPMMLMHGCLVGSFFADDLLFGEDWVFASNKGSLGMIAHSYFGIETNLKRYGDIFYQVAYGDSVFITKGMGDIMKEVSRRFIAQSGTAPVNTSQAQQMLLLGDPAVALFGAHKPDLEVNATTIAFSSFDGEPVTALTDSFRVSVVVRNFGQARPDTLRIEVQRKFNDNTIVTTDTIVAPILFSDTIVFTIRKGRTSGFGNNTFTITVDADNLIDELSETNNVATRELFIPLNGTRNLFPRNFSIVNTTSTTLSWQTTDTFSDEREFLLEVDTINTFDSPYKQSFSITAKVLARKVMTLLSNDSLAYYWRTRLKDPQNGEREEWEQSSFTYINNSPDGWAQVHFPQYLSNNKDGLITDATLREIKFQETVTDVSVTTFGDANAATNRDVSVKIQDVEYNLFTQSYGGFGCRDNSLNLIAFDKRSTVPYIGIPFKWYNRLERACGREPWVINNFKPSEMNTGNGDDITAYVDNIAVGDSVLLYSIGDAGYASWPATAKTKLGELGISVAQLDALQPGEAVVIFGRKGAAPGTATFYRDPSSSATARLDVARTITGRYSSGSMTSTLIGPAQAWQSFHEHFSDKEPQDEIKYDIIGVDLEGKQETLYTDVIATQDLSSISATTYPYLKVAVRTADGLNLTSPQVDHWIVLYTPVPEGLTTFLGTPQPQVLVEGDVWNGQYGFINIGDKNFPDSLDVSIQTFNHDRGQLESTWQRIKSPAISDTTVFKVAVASSGRKGLNDVQVYVNPRLVREQYYDNNVVALVNHLDVQGDFYKPVMDVTVDGRHLSEGDFVSASPFIVVKLWDENHSLLKTDVAGMKIFLTYPCDTEICDPTPIDLSGDEVHWYPATATSDFKIEFSPTALPDGKYTLRVEAADAQGNTSGADPYLIDFNVKNATVVSILPPFPNPFVNETITRVVISGDVLPEQLQLQIIDVTGKLIRTFAPESIHVGTNAWSWDGNDQSGSAVRAGVYVFKTFFTISGKEYQKNSKVVLLR